MTWISADEEPPPPEPSAPCPGGGTTTETPTALDPGPAMQAIVVPVFTLEIVVVVGLVNLIAALRGLLDEPQPGEKVTAAINADARTTFTSGNHRRSMGQPRKSHHAPEQVFGSDP